MELQIAGTNIAITPEVRKYVERKLGKLKRYLNNIREAKIELSEEKTKSPENRYRARVTADSRGAVFHGEERGKDLFTVIDKVSAVMTRQLEQHKEKIIEKRRGVSSFARTGLSAATTTVPEHRVVKTKHFTIEPMTLSDAIEQMETLGHDFFLFLDADARGLELVYRRKDGNYGLIIPEME